MFSQVAAGVRLPVIITRFMMDSLDPIQLSRYYDEIVTCVYMDLIQHTYVRTYITYIRFSKFPFRSYW